MLSYHFGHKVNIFKNKIFIKFHSSTFCCNHLLTIGKPNWTHCIMDIIKKIFHTSNMVSDSAHVAPYLSVSRDVDKSTYHSHIHGVASYESIHRTGSSKFHNIPLTKTVSWSIYNSKWRTSVAVITVCWPHKTLS